MMFQLEDALKKANGKKIFLFDLGKTSLQVKTENSEEAEYIYESLEGSLDRLRELNKKNFSKDEITILLWDELLLNIEKIELWITEITSFMKKNDALLFYKEKNYLKNGILTKAFACELSEEEKRAYISGLNQNKIDILFEKAGLCVKENYDEKEEIDKVSSDNTLLASGTLANAYLSWLESIVSKYGLVKTFSRVYEFDNNNRDCKKEDGNEEKPFLSVITRTQGRRPEALRETLLSLSAQTDNDFEVLLMGHKLNDKQSELVSTIIEEVPEELRKRIRLIRVETGNRTTPINEGFENAKGEYAIILDDDDIVFDNWVEEFKKKSKEAPGAILHAYVIAQEWMTVPTKSGVDALRACGSPSNMYCKKFNWLEEVYANSCPPVGLAFPTYPFKNWNIRFDETLDTTEDWDYLMRLGFLCGVADIETPTCIYRLWVNAESSQTVHSKELWVKNHKIIQKKFESVPIVLPQGYSRNISVFIQSKGSVVDGQVEDGVLLGESCPLYYNLGSGISEKNVIKQSGVVNENRFEYIYNLPNEKVYSYRWDPTENKDKLVENLEITLVDNDNKEYPIAFNNIRTNGIKTGKAICFLKQDPQIIIKANKNISYSKMIITGKITGEIPDEYIDMILGNRIIVKVKSKIKRVIKKVYYLIRK